MKESIFRRLEESKREIDRMIEVGATLPAHDLGPLSLFYLWWSSETQDSKSFDQAVLLRDLAAASIVGDKSSFSSVDAPFANHISLKIWDELNEPSQIWVAHRSQAIQSLERAAKPILSKPRNSEYFYGASGVGIIALQLGATDIADKVVEYLEADLVATEFGPLFPLSLAAENAWKGKTGPYHVGVAHGAAGPLLFLKFHSRKSKQSLRLEKLISTLSDSICSFIEMQKEGIPAVWCSGSLGISYALLAPSKRPPNARARKVGRAIFDRDIDFAVKALREPSFCHGFAGAAQTALRLNPRKADPIIECLLQAKIPSESPQILSGELGIALTLMSRVFKTDLKWDRHLLLSE